MGVTKFTKSSIENGGTCGRISHMTHIHTRNGVNWVTHTKVSQTTMKTHCYVYSYQLILSQNSEYLYLKLVFSYIRGCENKSDWFVGDNIKLETRLSS